LPPHSGSQGPVSKRLLLCLLPCLLLRVLPCVLPRVLPCVLVPQVLRLLLYRQVGLFSSSTCDRPETWVQAQLLC